MFNSLFYQYLFINYWKCKYPMNPHVPLLLVGWSVDWMVGRYVIISFKVTEFTLPCTNRSTSSICKCLFLLINNHKWIYHLNNFWVSTCTKIVNLFCFHGNLFKLFWRPCHIKMAFFLFSSILGIFSRLNTRYIISNNCTICTMEANLVLFIFKGITHPPAPIFFRSIQNTSYSPTLSFSEATFASINEVLR